MKVYGDVSDEDKVLIKNLEEMERVVDSNAEINSLLKSKCYVCLAHDYLDIHIEEESERLFEKAEKMTPGYFENEMNVHTEEDPQFKKLIGRLSMLLLNMIFDRVKNSHKTWKTLMESKQ